MPPKIVTCTILASAALPLTIRANHHTALACVWPPTGVEAEGWIGGVVPREAPALPGCPAGLSAATCAVCLASANPRDCFVCIRQSPFYSPKMRTLCAMCATLSEPHVRRACVQCLEDFGAAVRPEEDGHIGCTGCLVGAGMRPPKVDWNATEACFGCVADGGAAGRSTGACAGCHHVPKRNGSGEGQRACLACAADEALSPLMRMGCAACYIESSDPAKCVACLAKSGRTTRQCVALELG